MSMKKHTYYILSLSMLLLTAGLPLGPQAPEAGAQSLSLDTFRQLVILENGRKKPLDTFAENVLKQFSGRGRFQRKAAVTWMARVLFTPEVSQEDKVFLVTNPEVLESMGLSRQGKARDRYSFAVLRTGLQKLRQLAFKASKLEGNQRSFVENEIIGLYNKLYIYQQLISALDFAVPHKDFALTHEANRTLLGFPAGQKEFSFLDLARVLTKIRRASAPLRTKDPAEQTEAEKELARLTKNMERWAAFYADSPLTVIPGLEAAGTADRKEKWNSPWQLAISVLRDPHAAVPAELLFFEGMRRAYIQKDQAGFDSAVEGFNAAVIQAGGDRIRNKAVSLEVFYNKLDPFYKAKFFYGFAVIFLLLSFMVLKKWFYRLSMVLLAGGFLLQLLGISARMYIRLRPPVTNLYETFLFTGLITALLGIILELSGKRHLGIATGGISGLVMLMIAGKYALEGDTMGMLVAVLDSNFWLAIHVITIILGYAGVVLSGVIGHVYIVQRIFMPQKEDVLKNTFQAIYATQAFGIVFTFIGTVLGGIWADQSWGRFWGWDPKENGALLILLWCAILFHARLAGWIKELGMAFGTVIGVICVSLAWFGVNLLGVGLHSYGFTSGVANTLFLFIAVEVLFIGITAPLAGNRGGREAPRV